MAVDFPREVALKILYDINEKGAYSNISLNKYLEGYELRDIDRAFITELVYGTVKWKLSIDWIIQQFSSLKLKKLSPWILNVLRLGVYQLLYTQKIPESAAVNESVGLSKKYGHQASSRFVNAVLRNISRNRENIKYPDINHSIQYLSVRYSHPEWMVKNWLDRYGKEFTEDLLERNNQIPDMTVRVNQLKTTKEKLIHDFSEAGIDTAEGKYAGEAVILKNPSAITRMELFKQGHFQVQDESSMLVGKVLDPKPGELIVDVCSAPGGKATHIAELMKDKGTVLARDIHEHKIKLISDAAQRLGLSIIKTGIYDATVLDENLVGQADRVLVDAPCSGLGIIRRKPDIKWARNIGDKEEITKLQRKILQISSQYVKPGGILVYSTCTIEPEENEEIIKSFMQEHKQFERVDLASVLPSALVKPTSRNGYIQLFPNIDEIDGFFIAKMIRRGSNHE